MRANSRIRAASSRSPAAVATDYSCSEVSSGCPADGLDESLVSYSSASPGQRVAITTSFRGSRLKRPSRPNGHRFQQGLDILRGASCTPPHLSGSTDVSLSHQRPGCRCWRCLSIAYAREPVELGWRARFKSNSLRRKLPDKCAPCPRIYLDASLGGPTSTQSSATSIGRRRLRDTSVLPLKQVGQRCDSSQEAWILPRTSFGLRTNSRAIDRSRVPAAHEISRHPLARFGK